MSRTYDALKKAEAERAGKQDGSVRMSPLDPTVSPRARRHRAPRINLTLNPYVEEKYQKLRGNLFAGSKTQIKSLLVVAAEHGEGATTTATLLASTLAKTSRSRIVLVDANLRTSSLAEVFGLDNDRRGLTDFMTGAALLDEIVRPSPFVNLWVITSGRPISSPSYLFDVNFVENLLQALRERFDFIILDGAPVGDYSDSYILGSKADGTLLVLEADKTRIETAQGIMRELERAGARIIGAVLNKKKNYIPALLDRVF